MNPYDTDYIGNILKNNSYPGRGIIVGKSDDDKFAVFAYFIMGRSENSRNRIFVNKNDELTIYPFDASKVADPTLIIYSPVRTYKNKIIVTNGDQTDTVYEYLSDNKTFEEALYTREFEPDKPNFTPRISALLNFDNNYFNYKLNILKSADEKGLRCNRFNFDYTPISGIGHFIHTYNNNADPLPSFTGEPQRVFIPDYIDIFSDEIWNNLNYDNKISLYVCYINISNGEKQSRLFNKNL